jgi:hypothetical protein
MTRRRHERSGQEPLGSRVRRLLLRLRYLHPLLIAGFHRNRPVGRLPQPPTPSAVLEEVARLPVSTWRYLWEPPDVRHLGPMAQDFATAFGLGDDNRWIHETDAAGVNLVAIQALYRYVQALETRVAALERQPGTKAARDPE